MKTCSLALVALMTTVACRAALGQAEIPIRVCLYSSLTTGTSDKDALAAGGPMTARIDSMLSAAVKAKVHNKLEVYHGKTTEELLEFGDKLNRGEIDLGEVWGIEYGWLKAKYPKLEAAAVC